MADMKHVGRTVKGNRKCIVAFRVVPNEPESCLVVFTDSLEAADHDSLISLVESNAGQNAYELADAMARTNLSDGRVMLAAFHRTGKLVKIPTSEIKMTPNFTSSVLLSELNNVIAEQKGVTVADLAVTSPSNDNETTTESAVETETVAQDGVLSDEDLAAQYRSQADTLFKEAKRLREQAEELVPTKKKAKSKTEESA